MTQREKILVLRVIKYGEADLIVHGLNADGARINFLARGGAKSRKRFAGGLLEATHYLEVTYKSRGGGGDGDPLHTLMEAQMVRDFPGLRTDYARLETALFLVKLVHKLGQQGVVDSPDLFNLLGNALAAAETSGDLDTLRLHFQLRLLNGQGVLPHDDIFRPWLATPLGQHETISSRGEQRALVSTLIHDHLRHYLGSLDEKY